MKNPLLAKTLHNSARVQIGRNGLSENVVKHILNYLKSQKYLKIKFLFIEDNSDFESQIFELLKSTDCRLVDRRGKTIVIEKLNR